MVETALFIEVEKVIDNLALQITLILVLTIIITIILYQFKIGRKKKKVKKKISRGDEEKRVAMASKIDELKSENSELQGRLQNLELKQVEDIDDIDAKKQELDQKEAEVNESLGEILAIKEALSHHRMRVGKLEKEKEALLKEIRDLKAEHKNEKEEIKNEFEAQKERIKNEVVDGKSRLEEEKEEIREKAKETIMRHEKERAMLISKLQLENKKLKNAVSKMKDKLGIWEKIEDLG